MIRLRFLYLFAVTFALHSAAPAWQGLLLGQPNRGTVLATQSAKPFDSPDGLPDPNEIYFQVNRARVVAGLEPLARNDTLTKLATERAQDMSQNSYYAHLNKQGEYFFDVLAHNGYHADYTCENLNLDFTTLPSIYVDSWLQSTAGHKECLLNPRVTTAGYAVATIANSSTNEMPSYVVVAIHATVPRASH